MAANEKLKQIIERLGKAERAANEDLSGWDSRTLPGAQLRKQQAKDEVRTLTAEYKALAPKHFFRVFVVGERAAEFAAFAEKEGAIVADGAELYKHLAKGVEQTLEPGNRRFGPHQQWRLNSEMITYGQTHSFFDIAPPVVATQDLDTMVPTGAELLEKVRKAVRVKNGDKLNLFHMEREIVGKAIKTGAVTNIIPVVIFGLTTEEIQELNKTLFAGAPAMDLTADANSTNEALLKTVNKKIQSVFKAGNTKQ